jgi:hypothetical protein
MGRRSLILRRPNWHFKTEIFGRRSAKASNEVEILQEREFFPHRHTRPGLLGPFMGIERRISPALSRARAFSIFSADYLELSVRVKPCRGRW